MWPSRQTTKEENTGWEKEKKENRRSTQIKNPHSSLRKKKRNTAPAKTLIGALTRQTKLSILAEAWVKRK